MTRTRCSAPSTPGAATPMPTSPPRPAGTSPASPETLLPLIDDDTERAIELAQARSAPSPTAETARWAGWVPSSVITRRRRRRGSPALAGDLVWTWAAHQPRRLHRVLRRPHRPGRPRRCRAVRGLFIDLAGFDAWLTPGGRWHRRCRGDGPGQPDLHPAQPPPRGGPHRRHGWWPRGSIRQLLSPSPSRTPNGPAWSATANQPRGLRAIPHLLGPEAASRPG